MRSAGAHAEPKQSPILVNDRRPDTLPQRSILRNMPRIYAPLSILP